MRINIPCCFLVVISYLSKITIKNIKWTIILGAEHVLNIILDFHFNTIPFIVLPTLKLLISILFAYLLESPLLLCRPFLLTSQYYNWFVLLFVLLNEILKCIFMLNNSVTIIGKIPEFCKVLLVGLLYPRFFSAQLYKSCIYLVVNI